MEKKNPFAIRKSPVELINAQTVNIDDYVKRYDPRCGVGPWNPPCNSLDF